MQWTDFLSVEKKLGLEKLNLNSEPTYIGIDFGTSTTVVSIAKLDNNGNIIAKHLDIKQPLYNGATKTDYRINSAVAKNKNKILIGVGAKEFRSRLKQNVNYWESFKMHLGTDFGVAYPKSEIPFLKNPTDVTTLFFKALKKYIDTYVEENSLNKVIKYAITIPASFESHHRRDLLKCLNSANINVEESGLIDEPNAAFLSYSLLPNVKGNELYISEEFNPIVLVFDFGAGTCDISIIEIGENTNGLYTKNISLSQFAEIGGDNLDKMIAEKFLLPQLLKQSNINKSDLRRKEIQLEILPHLKDLGEKLKIQVSEKIELFHDIVELPDNELENHKFHVSITKKINSRLGELHIHNPEINLKQFIEVSNFFQFDVDFSGLNLQINPVYSAMEKSKLKPSDIDYILFIGGSTKNYLIRKQLQKVFSKSTVLKPNNPQSHVSQGAAVHSLLLNKFDTHIIKPITNQNVYTIIIANNQEMKVNLIQAGETVPFPTKIFNQFKPNQNGQKVIEIPFFTGNDQIELEKIVLESPSDLGFKMTDKIAISVDVNSNKVLIITAKINDVETKIIVENPFLSDGKTVKDKEVRNALKAFNKDSSENNGFPSKEAYNVLIKAYEKNRDYLSAAELLEEAVERHDLKDQYNNLNLLFGKAGNIDKSQKYAEKAIESSPNNSVFLFNMATRFRYSNPKKSIELLEKAYKINQNSPTICYLLGSLLGGEKGNSLMRNAFNLWQVKLMNDKMEQWDYSWFSSCALDLGEIIVYREITKKEKELKQNEEGFYNVENLMGMAENKSKNKSKNQ